METYEPVEQGQVVFLGDSHIDNWRGWPEEYGVASGDIVSGSQNFGVGGAACIEILAWIQTVLEATNPETVVFSCGVNDILFTQDVDGTVASVQNIWSALDAHESVKHVVYLNPFTDVSMVPGWEFYNPLQDQVNPLIESTIQSSDSTMWTYVDLDGMDVLQQIREAGGIATDGLHFTEVGYQILNPIVLDALDTVLIPDTCSSSGVTSTNECYFGDSNSYETLSCSQFINGDVCGHEYPGDNAEGECDDTSQRYRICNTPRGGEDACAQTNIFTVEDCANAVRDLIEEGICDASGMFYSSLCDANATRPSCVCHYAGSQMGDYQNTGHGNSVYVLKDDTTTAGPTADCEAKPAPTNSIGYIPSAIVVEWVDVNEMPEECGPIFWNSDGTAEGSYAQVPDNCCSDATVLAPLTDLWPQTDNCFVFDPVGDRSFIYGTWAGGCSDDGTFFYGEKCGGSDFGDWAEAAYGQCSQPEEYCHCIGTVETQAPGCFAIATIIPPPGQQNAVFLQVDGCLLIPDPEPTTSIKETEEPCIMVDCMPECSLVDADENGCGGICDCGSTASSTTEEVPVCCQEMTADCLACSAGMTVEEYCEMHPGTVGCVTEEPKICCQALTAECLACSMDMAVEDYCVMFPETNGCATNEPVGETTDMCEPIVCGCPGPTFEETDEKGCVISCTCLNDACGATESATYDVEFTAIWTEATSPNFWVENAHFSRIVGWSSAEVINMEGQLASSFPGIQAQAETGSPNEWASTLASRFGFVAVGNRGTGTVDGYELSDTVQLTIDPSQPYASFTAMVAPSPDWFVYGNGAPLCNENGWVESLEIEASYILDAGTDAGTDFTSDNEAEDPPVVITSLGDQGPMMSIRFTKSSGTTEQPTDDSSADCSEKEGDDMAYLQCLQDRVNALQDDVDALSDSIALDTCGAIYNGLLQALGSCADQRESQTST